MKGEYNIKAIPINNKSWEETEKIEVLLELETKTEKKVFKGIITLNGIIKRIK